MVQFLGEETAENAMKEAYKLQAGGKLRPAKMSRGDGRWGDDTTRGDEMMWLTDLEIAPCLRVVLDNMAALRDELMAFDDGAIGLDPSKRSVQLAFYR